jgi:hypothetical protein
MIQKSQLSLPLHVYVMYVVDEGLPKPRNDLTTSVLAQCTSPLGHNPLLSYKYLRARQLETSLSVDHVCVFVVSP